MSQRIERRRDTPPPAATGSTCRWGRRRAAIAGAVLPHAAAQHRPRRPSWACTCGSPWPCQAARLQLKALIADTGVRALIGMMLSWYTTDHPGADPAEVHDRFLGWALP